MSRRAYLLVELLLWFAAPIVFLGVYVIRFRNPPVVIIEHLYPVALVVAAGMLAKLGLYRLLPWRNAVLALNALFFVSLQLALIAYYALVLTGLKSWGKVISEELIGAYARQAAGLCDSMGLSLPALAAGVLFAHGGLTVLYFGFARRFEPAPRPSTPRFPRSLTAALLLCTLLLLTHRLWDYLVQSHPGSREPFTLTLYSGKAPPSKIDRSIVFNDAFERQENAARLRYRPSPDALRKNVILIVADGLRADHLQPYGYPRPTSPYLERQVALGKLERFDNVHSTCSESNCSMASLLASRYVQQLPSDPFTLPQVLKLHGYKTVMILGGDQTNYYNKRLLFGKIDDYFDGSMATGYYMNDDSFVAARTRLLPQWDGKPAMLQFHLMSAHLLGKRLDAYRHFMPSASYARVSESAPQQRFTNFYDNGVLQYDDFVRQILETLGAKKYLDDAIVIITSDHGESLGERGLMAHANGVHEPVLHIPLLISGLKAPAQALVGAPFLSQIDIAPTVLQELGMPIPESWRGTSLRLPQAERRNRELTDFQMYDFRGLFDGRQAGTSWKYWINRHTKEEFVFDLVRDPLELNNIVWQVPVGLRDEWRKHIASDLPR
jgi:glucan phosphoethanolaminetransferase (alkaline phosphatase superfamily)